MAGRWCLGAVPTSQKNHEDELGYENCSETISSLIPIPFLSAMTLRLTQLQELSLSGTQVTDVGLEHLTGLTQLQWLDLFDTQVSDDGVRKLQQALSNCWVYR